MEDDNRMREDNNTNIAEVPAYETQRERILK